MDIIRWPYQADMRVLLADGSFQTIRVQWNYAQPAAKPLPFPHSYGSSNYYEPQGFDKLEQPGELLDGRVRNRRLQPPPTYKPRPCPDDAQIWNADKGV